jgi:Glyoxalase-like domain
LELDHVLVAVTDLAEAAQGLEARHGLVSIGGGRHPGWGTANRIVPLGESYVELVAVVDEAEALHSPFGRWVASAHPAPARPLGWAVRTPRLDEVARRLGLTVAAGSRLGQDGRRLHWRLAGVEQASVEPSLPFFIEWGRGAVLPGRGPTADRVGALRIAELHVDGDVDRLASWLGAHHLPVTVRPGAPAVTRIVLEGAGAAVALDLG